MNELNDKYIPFIKYNNNIIANILLNFLTYICFVKYVVIAAYGVEDLNKLLYIVANIIILYFVIIVYKNLYLWICSINTYKKISKFLIIKIIFWIIAIPVIFLISVIFVYFIAYFFYELLY